MKNRLIITIISVVSLFILVCVCSGLVNISGIKRTELQRSDISIAGREFVQVRIDFDPGTAYGKHSHPGEEIIYVLEGVLEYQIAGKNPVRLKAGDVLFIPSGTVHAARNTGNIKAKELATYIVEKGKPLVVLIK